jgi:hypothetical protein
LADAKRRIDMMKGSGEPQFVGYFWKKYSKKKVGVWGSKAPYQ